MEKPMVEKVPNLFPVKYIFSAVGIIAIAIFIAMVLYNDVFSPAKDQVIAKTEAIRYERDLEIKAKNWAEKQLESLKASNANGPLPMTAIQKPLVLKSLSDLNEFQKSRTPNRIINKFGTLKAEKRLVVYQYKLARHDVVYVSLITFDKDKDKWVEYQ